MAQRSFEDLTWRGQVRRLSELARNGLARFGLRAERLSCLGHWENATFRADLTRELRPRNSLYHPRRVLVRVHRPGYQTLRTIESELDWVEALASVERLAVPTPLRTKRGERVIPVEAPGVPEPRNVSVLRWLPGPILEERRTGLDDDRLVGEAMGLLHAHARSWKRPPGFRRNRKNVAGMMGRGRAFEELPADLVARIPKRAHRVLAGALRRGQDAVRRAEADCGPLLLIHCDLHGANAIRHPERIGVIDFDDCGVGSAALDVAIAIGSMRFQEDWTTRRGAFVEGYERALPFDPRILPALDGLMTARTSDWLLWAASRAGDNPRFAENLDGWTDAILRRLRRLRR